MSVALSYTLTDWHSPSSLISNKYSDKGGVQADEPSQQELPTMGMDTDEDRAAEPRIRKVRTRLLEGLGAEAEAAVLAASALAYHAGMDGFIALAAAAGAMFAAFLSVLTTAVWARDERRCQRAFAVLLMVLHPSRDIERQIRVMRQAKLGWIAEPSRICSASEVTGRTPERVIGKVRGRCPSGRR
jgi:hypothetical protein